MHKKKNLLWHIIIKIRHEHLLSYSEREKDNYDLINLITDKQTLFALMKKKECYYSNHNKYDINNQDKKILKKTFLTCSFIYIINKESKNHDNILM